jgi:hypothetical protein
VVSQVVLSFGIPFVLIPLVPLSRRRDITGALMNRRSTTVIAAAVAAVICCLKRKPDRAHGPARSGSPSTPTSTPAPTTFTARPASTSRAARAIPL